ncbi:hypothetical protein MKX01_028925 [Papaver californicum]|nr:hypothetical protein MKX01_028925 [Papaver californicum]
MNGKLPPTIMTCVRGISLESKPPVIKSHEVHCAILDAICNGEVEDVVRLIVLYMCQTIFFTRTGNSSLPCNYLVYVKNVDVINRISWPHLIHRAMMDSIESSNGGSTQVTRCSFFYSWKNYIFTRWNTLKISKSIVSLGKFPYTKIRIIIQLSQYIHGLKNRIDGDFEIGLTTPIIKKSRLEKMNDTVIGLEMENVAFIQDKDDKNNKLCRIEV